MFIARTTSGSERRSDQHKSLHCKNENDVKYCKDPPSLSWNIQRQRESQVHWEFRSDRDWQRDANLRCHVSERIRDHRTQKICDKFRFVQIVDFVDGRSFDRCLSSENSKSIYSLPLLLKFFREIISALVFLEEKNFVFRYLISRNILITRRNSVKLCELDECCFSSENDSTFFSAVRRRFPATIFDDLIRENNSKTTVFLFGILLVEAFSYAEEKEIRFDEMTRFSRPTYATMEIFNILTDCCRAEPEDRPNLKNLQEIFGQIEFEQVRWNENQVFLSSLASEEFLLFHSSPNGPMIVLDRWFDEFYSISLSKLAPFLVSTFQLKPSRTNSFVASPSMGKSVWSIELRSLSSIGPKQRTKLDFNAATVRICFLFWNSAAFRTRKENDLEKVSFSVIVWTENLKFFWKLTNHRIILDDTHSVIEIQISVWQCVRVELCLSCLLSFPPGNKRTFTNAEFALKTFRLTIDFGQILFWSFCRSHLHLQDFLFQSFEKFRLEQRRKSLKKTIKV